MPFDCVCLSTRMSAPEGRCLALRVGRCALPSGLLQPSQSHSTSRDHHIPLHQSADPRPGDEDQGAAPEHTGPHVRHGTQPGTDLLAGGHSC